ncbi:MAG TPA: MlaD family protein, partial [Gemmataceae bacterium]
MSERRLRLRLGLFVLAALAGLVFLLFLFGRAPRLFVPSSQYTVIFPEAPGVKPGTPVRRSGVRVGEVTDLDLDPQTGLVRLTLSLDTRHAPRAN